MEDKIQHLEYFKIENFKGLDSLELKDIKQFNIILGDNNVGKTSVLEALLFDKLPYNLLSYLYNRFIEKSGIREYFSSLNYLDFFTTPEKGILYAFKFKKTKIEKINLSLIDSNFMTPAHVDNLVKNTLVNTSEMPEKFLRFNLNEEENFFSLDFFLHRIKNQETYYPFVKSGLTYDKDLVNFYSKNIVSDVKLKMEFIENLHILSDDIYDLVIDTTTVPENPILLVLFNNGNKPIPLFMMGEGFIRLIRLILEIFISKNARLMIDEIDNGMHFSRMKEVWRVLLKVAKKNNTQLFITTHDAECLRSFKEVLETEEFSGLQEDVASYTLIRNRENKVQSVKYNFREFEHAIDYSLNIRG